MSLLLSHNHMTQEKDIEDSETMISYNMFSIYWSYGQHMVFRIS